MNKLMHAETSEITESPQFCYLKLAVGPQKHICFVSGLQCSSQSFSIHLYLCQTMSHTTILSIFSGLPPFLWPDQLCKPPLSINSRWREPTQIRLLSLLSTRIIRNSITWWKERQLTCSIISNNLRAWKKTDACKYCIVPCNVHLQTCIDWSHMQLSG